MILPDSSVWIQHLRRPDPAIQVLIDGELIAGHPCVTLEVALRRIADRRRTPARLRELPQIALATLAAVADVIERRSLWSRGIGFADASPLVSTLLAPGTRDRRSRAPAIES